MELQIGSTIGDYQVVDVLGAGGMGKVYKVRNVISDRIEAMKVLLPDLTSVADLAERFLREIKLQASLVHPNIAQLHTAVRADNQLLMVMEFVEGQTVDQLLRRGPLPIDRALDCISQVLTALEFAHARGVIHRDIKPANMMMTPAGVIKLMDFGIAKAADQKLTITGTTVGSVYYMSPEQIQGASTLDARADLYSVGVTLYELVTGKRPFDGESQYAIMAAHLEKAPVPPIELDPTLPRELNDVILLAVAKDPGRRFQSAAAFGKALGSVKAMLAPATVPVAAPPPPPPPIVRASNGGKRWLWMTCGGIAAAAVLVCALQFAPGKATHAAQQPAAQQPAAQSSTRAEASSQTQPAAHPAPPADPDSAPAPPPSQPDMPNAAALRKPDAVSPRAQRQPQPTVAAQLVQSPSTTAAAQAIVPPSAPAPAPGPSRAEIAEVREQIARLGIRAGAIRESMDNLRSSMAAQGLAPNARFTQPQGLMDAYLRSAGDAMAQFDLPAAREYSDKAERQIEILEKLLNL